ncbi:DUF202 domain-containing protein [Parahaliea sp. F7430]|uniref:DUF202 domain-containing protein n=1 Tax=Sediminihaliea albiluteola TaxID=2758564 RepID=A0A7W2YKN0_9GAMM|nr:DUF202 domain-containing protein [Sediminihaliea albiluteola]MBA6414335.1 DUF202 domain-containing protein [Sediminihaliea albiluteola]
MAYLKDPRVYYAIERTYLAWVRTQLSILALALLIKKFGIEDLPAGDSRVLAETALLVLCALVVLMSVVSFWLCRSSVRALGAEEIPSTSAAAVLYASGLVVIVLNILISLVVAVI